MYQYSKNNLPTGLSFLFVNLSTIGKRDLNLLKASIFLNSQLIDAKGLSNSKAPKFGTLSLQN